MENNTNVFDYPSFTVLDGKENQLPEMIWAYSLSIIGHAQKTPKTSLENLKKLSNIFSTNHQFPDAPAFESVRAQLPSKDKLDEAQILVLPPVLAGTAWTIYERADNQDILKPLLKDIFEVALAYHRNLYEFRDTAGNGLISSFNNWESFVDIKKDGFKIYDPLFHALLCWSNKALINIGGLLSIDVLEVIEWNELTIYSINDQLWHSVLYSYFPYDQEETEFLSMPLPESALSLFGEMATQDQVELLYPQLEMQLKSHFDQVIAEEEMDVLIISKYLTLLEGTLAYDFDELSLLVRKQYLRLISKMNSAQSPFAAFVLEGLKAYF